MAIARIVLNKPSYKSASSPAATGSSPLLRPYQMLAAKISPIMTTMEIKLFFLMTRLPYRATPEK